MSTTVPSVTAIDSADQVLLPPFCSTTHLCSRYLDQAASEEPKAVASLVLAPELELVAELGGEPQPGSVLHHPTTHVSRAGRSTAYGCIDAMARVLPFGRGAAGSYILLGSSAV